MNEAECSRRPALCRTQYEIICKSTPHNRITTVPSRCNEDGCHSPNMRAYTSILKRRGEEGVVGSVCQLQLSRGHHAGERIAPVLQSSWPARRATWKLAGAYSGGRPMQKSVPGLWSMGLWQGSVISKHGIKPGIVSRSQTHVRLPAQARS